MAENLMKDLLLDQVLVSDGFTVDYTVGTTYSLDMETLLAVPLTLGLMGDAGEGNVAPHVLMEAIRASADKFVVFCNAGCIAVPHKNSRVFSLLEDCVNQVALPAAGKGFVNFHPQGMDCQADKSRHGRDSTESLDNEPQPYGKFRHGCGLRS